jgi:hypothetical protein
VAFLDMSDDRADGLFKRAGWDKWEAARSEVSRIEMQARQALKHAVALTIEALRNDDHKIGRAIETATDVFGYQAAIKKRLMRPTARVQTGRNLWEHPTFIAGRDGDSAPIICAVIREVAGNPFRKVKFNKKWRTDTAVTLARQMYESRDFSAMPILADALQDAGCGNDDVLSHCRDPKQVHVRGCWVVDLVLGKS